MPTILFVINPISGGIRKNTLKKEIEESFDGRIFRLAFFETTGKDDPVKLQGAIREHQPDTVVACGGDGTINLVAGAISKMNISLGIIPMGSANGLATELRIPEHVPSALEIIQAGRTRNIDALQINDKFLSLHLADLGFNAKLIKRFEQAGQRGKWGYARQFVKTLFTQESVRYYFLLDDNNFSRRAQMVSFANARKYGTGAVVNPDGRIDDGLFEICIFRPYPWYALIGLIFRFFTGSLKKSKYVKILSAREVTVWSREAEVLQVDGETVGEFNEINVRILPARFTILVRA